MAAGRASDPESTAGRGGPHRLTALASRYSTALKWVSGIVIVVSVFLLLRQLPLAALVKALEVWVADLGLWGPVVFGLIYVVAVVLLVPASALTIAAGAIFGLLVGTVVVSLASTTGAALAFLVSRYLARDAIARKLAQSPRFAALDRAVSAGGWKVVALLRLSPAVPFNLQNYLYGLTGIRSWTCVLTSWLAMLPGTLLYVYLGYAGRASVEAAAGGRSRSPAEWALLVVGLLATVAVTVYVTRLARKALAERADLAGTSEAGGPRPEPPGGPPRWPWGATAAALLAVIALGVAVFAQLRPEALETLFAGRAGPPQVTLREAYEPKPNGPHFDHSTWDRIVKIEHEQIRPKFREPRIHFALVCAAVGCPKLRDEAYQADRLDEQLEDQAVYGHSHDRWFRFEPDQGVVHLTKLYLWYGSDFRQVAGLVLNFAARYVSALKAALDAGQAPEIRWLEYDWSLNSKENAP